ncbi:peptide chain release factor N(5)-glutamine methyltransferase [Tsuneonella sp. YG55]|uniref:Release factor glutamine methyltransferase n=1 Tax=Tsuneonella litorea TaxID=2976475 RepID=A0A9X2VYF2_9SPHN|nr:peptide chain release factor N(5)-glutamine methyltransferase [Tsuneonella litorea]MCT2557607.1 peptide chain release factor N(5)-glutamine methyltransferase [Tsuneonella litorea]
MSVRLAINEAAEVLSATSDTPRLDAELLMAALLGATRSEMLLRRMSDEVPPGWGHLVRRRMQHEPVAYILGEAEFRGLPLEVSPAVLIPRGDSETIVEAAIEAFTGREPPRTVLDLGTGSGALLLALIDHWVGARGIGIDASAPACAVASRNAERLGLGARCRIVQADWTLPGWRDRLGLFDLVVANPPYVEAEAALDPDVRDHEPASALFAGSDGLDEYRVLVPQLPALLESAGVAVLEIGHAQDDAVGRIAAAAGFACTLRHDLAGRPRAVILRRN